MTAPVHPVELQPLVNRIETMLKGSESSGWPIRGPVECRAVSLYIRVGMRPLRLDSNLGSVPSLELANIHVLEYPRLSFRRRGVCKAVLTSMEHLADKYHRVFVIDTVLNPHLRAHLLTRPGYIAFGAVEAPSFYRQPQWFRREAGQDIPDLPSARIPVAA